MQCILNAAGMVKDSYQLMAPLYFICMHIRFCLICKLEIIIMWCTKYGLLLYYTNYVQCSFSKHVWCIMTIKVLLIYWMSYKHTHCYLSHQVSEMFILRLLTECVYNLLDEPGTVFSISVRNIVWNMWYVSALQEIFG